MTNGLQPRTTGTRRDGANSNTSFRSVDCESYSAAQSYTNFMKCRQIMASPFIRRNRRALWMDTTPANVVAIDPDLLETNSMRSWQ